MVQWFRLHASNAADVGSIPGQGNRIPHVTHKKKIKKKIQLPEDLFNDSLTKHINKDFPGGSVIRALLPLQAA